MWGLAWRVPLMRIELMGVVGRNAPYKIGDRSFILYQESWAVIL